MSRRARKLMERSIVARTRIDQFAERNALSATTYSHLGKNLLLLDIPETTPLEVSLASRYLTQHVAALETGITDNCYSIATEAQSSKSLPGAMSGDGTQGFIPWLWHTINYDTLPDGTGLAVDLTASANIDHRQGVFDVLAVRTPNLKELCPLVGDLYGGTWRVH